MTTEEGNITIVVGPDGNLIEVTQDGELFKDAEAEEGQVAIVLGVETLAVAQQCKFNPRTGRWVCT